jgi:hypothetical protein
MTKVKLDWRKTVLEICPKVFNGATPVSLARMVADEDGRSDSAKL